MVDALRNILDSGSAATPQKPPTVQDIHNAIRIAERNAAPTRAIKMNSHARKAYNLAKELQEKRATNGTNGPAQQAKAWGEPFRSDISRCNGKDCPSASTCVRAKMPRDEYVSVASFEQGLNGRDKCDWYMPTDGGGK